MKSKILKQEINPFLRREEYTLEVTSDSNPVEEEIKEVVGKDKELTVIRTISSNFGKNSFLVDVVVYESAEAKDLIQTIPQKIRKKMEVEKKKAEEAAKKAEEEKEAAKKAEEEEETSEDKSETKNEEKKE